MEWVDSLIRKQESMREKVILRDVLPERIRYVGGADQSFPEKDVVRSCVVVLNFPGLEEVESKTAEEKTETPYIPGLLSSREGPAIKKAYGMLERKPDVLFVDGHGIAHPRRIGLASHVGLELDIPSIGVAKRRLVGEYREPGGEGDISVIKDKDEILGFAYRSRVGCRPIYISPGHKISLYTSLMMTLECMGGHRLPETTRMAHIRVNER